MEFVVLSIIFIIAIGGAFALGRKANASRSSDDESPEPARQPHRQTQTTASGPLSLEEIRALSDQATASDGTAKIERGALQALVEGRSKLQAERAFFVVIAGDGIGRFIALERQEYVIGREPKDTDICFLDEAISKQHARVTVKSGNVFIEDLGSSNGTFVDGEEVHQPVMLQDGSRIVLGRSTVLALTFQDELGEKFQQQMYESSTRDQLTGAFNKATFLDHLGAEMRYAKRHKTNFLIVIMDIDHFKSVNDTYGHLVGDEILAQVSGVIRSVVREDAHFSRYGGEEFIVAERNASAEEGAIVAERIRAAVEGHSFQTEAGPLNVTMSLGVADLKLVGEADGTTLVRLADEALYDAKRDGRNRFVVQRNAT